MNYYYDIVLNFLEDSYEFYDVCESDAFEYIKKIPLFQVDNQFIKDIVSNNIVINKTFLDSLHNKTTTKDGSLEYAAIFADKNNVLALEFSNTGKILSRSNLTLEDELNVIEIIYTIDITKIEYELGELLIINKPLRVVTNIKRLITTEIDKLYNDKNISKMEFLYLEWFNETCTDIDIIYNKMKKSLEDSIGKKEEDISNIIKLSYNNV